MTQVNEKALELSKMLAEECTSTEDVATLLKTLFAGTIEQMLEAEMAEHLGYSKHSVEGNNSGNSRNGYNRKTIKSEWGESEISVPRDRNGEFEPRVIEKRQTRTDEIERRILAMYGKGMSVRDIEDQLRDIYGAEVSPALISNITDKILPQVTEWQNRPLDELYPVVFFDGVWFKMRKDSKVIKTRIHCIRRKYGRQERDFRHMEQREREREFLDKRVQRTEKSRCKRHFNRLSRQSIRLFDSIRDSFPEDRKPTLRHPHDPQFH